MNTPILNGFYENAKKEMLETLEKNGSYSLMELIEMLFRMFPYTDESICDDILAENPDFDKDLYSDMDFIYPENETRSEMIISNVQAFIQFKLEDYAKENGIDL